MDWLWLIAFVAVIGTIYFFSNMTSPDNQNSSHRGAENRQPATEEKEPNSNQNENVKRLPIGRLTLNELCAYNGANRSRIFISICGRIFDMSTAYDFYGIGGTYNCFAGGDATFMLGTMSLDALNKNKKDFTNSPEWDLDAQTTLGGWIAKYKLKYPIVGRLDGFENVAIECLKENDLEDKNNNETKKMTLEELKNNRNYLSVAGCVFDVSPAFMVYDSNGEIPDAIGNDITYALIKSEYKTENYNKPLNSIMENAEYKQRLKPILKSFRETYAMVGRLEAPFEITWEDEEWDIIHSSDAREA